LSIVVTVADGSTTTPVLISVSYITASIQRVCAAMAGFAVLSAAGCSVGGADFSAADRYIGSSSGFTAGAHAADFAVGVYSYSVRVPFLYQQLAVSAQTNWPALPVTVQLGSGLAGSVQLLAPAANATFGLAVGSNALWINSSDVDAYQLRIDRASQDVRSFQVQQLAASSATASASTLLPVSAGQFVYGLSVPFACAGVTVSALFDSAGTASLFSGDAAAVPLLSGVSSFSVALAVAQPVTLRVLSTMDGEYQLRITRAAASLTGAGLTLAALDAYHLATPVTSSMLPPFDPAVSSYNLSVPAGTTSIQVVLAAGAQPQVLPLVLSPDGLSGTLVLPTAGGNYTFFMSIPAPQHVLVVASSSAVASDPCATLATPLCSAGGSCVATAQAATPGADASFDLSCACSQSPVVYAGSACSFGVAACPSCISSFTGGAQLQLFGFALDSVTGIWIDGRPAVFDAAVAANFTLAADQQVRAQLPASLSTMPLQMVRFTSPSLVQQSVQNTSSHNASPSDAGAGGRRLFASVSDDDTVANPVSAYKLVTLRSWQRVSFAAGAPQLEVNLTTLLFYSSSSCLAAGTFGDDGTGGCRPCPDGAYCPGGGRAWPLQGWWSYSEYTSPSQCTVPKACPGVDTTTQANSASGFVDTQKCSEGYTGAQCSGCASGYYQLQQQCFHCGSSVDQQSTIALTVIAGVSILLLLALAVAALPSMALARAIQVFSLAQGAAAVSVSGAGSSPWFAKQLMEACTYINLINFGTAVLGTVGQS